VTSTAVTAPPIAPPGPGLDPTLALALGLSSSPGVYAMLLGSGVSRAARVPTGWEVVLDLIGKVAALQGEGTAGEAGADPEGWWRGQGNGEPRYDTLLESLAPSVAARRDLLHAYFEPADDDEREAGIKQPTAAHRAIAELVSSGRVRLILTTNFDHLMETALAEAGVPPQVIARADAIPGMAPLQHARATVIKFHGDYLDVQAIRNTPAELGSYDPAMNDLLARIFDEYGLVVVGWSGDWDTALIRAIESCPTRRYPTYWAAHRGRMSPAAAGLLASRAGHLIPIDGADSFCADLRDKVSALARMADPPPTRAVAVATVKRNLRPGRATELFDQINALTSRTIDRLAPDRYPVEILGLTSLEEAAAELGRCLSDYDSDTDALTAVGAAAVFHADADDMHPDDIILRAVRRLAKPPRAPGSYTDFLEGARRYPALRLATCVGVAAIAAGREGLLFRVLVETRSSRFESDAEVPLASALFPGRVLPRGDVMRLLPQLAGPGGGRPSWPASQYLRVSCRSAMEEMTDDREYTAAFDRYEFLRGMLEIAHGQHQSAALGEFVTRAGAPAGNLPDADEITDQWPLIAAGAFGRDVASAADAYVRLTEQIRQPRSL
jgi:hypothetical protein